ncbi:galactonate dehydratase [Alteromonas lipolytica]|uniref:Galactonate dehydratase n=1 Tax=Alteromonas lipolytica TaxID=1856405 RepID=A0A1E8FIK0_9ALTE|nr:galactonate dehydratase [Alteromonas lipolytica]OFI35438.1 galactonate dehydratase [Alteromonas lipolytica]GGF76257.1 D-galactonate dehydratase [Alteromonas lipolytica]
MKITQLRLYPVAPRWCFLAIDTDEGITGWGEPIIEGKVETVMAAVKELEFYLLDKDPANINDLWQLLYRGGFYRGGPILMSAIAGIEQALWDIKGKVMGQPVHQLLGGRVRDKMKVYSWVGGDDPADEIAQIKQQQTLGRNTFKLNGCGKMALVDSHKAVDEVIERIGLIRETFGNTVDFGLDFHGRVSVPMAKVLLKELEFARPLFVEEPVLAEQYEQYSVLSSSTSIVLAAGERMYTRAEFKRVLSRGGLGILQPDVSHAGGILETVKIAAMAEAYDVTLAPHCPLGPIAFAACLAVDFVSYNAVLQETSLGMHYNTGADLLDYVVNKDDFAITDGYIAPLTKPGLGVELNEEAIYRAAEQHTGWRNPVWRHQDGSVAEW